jgi:predicted RNA-binding Zn ribbon-like protein
VSRPAREVGVAYGVPDPLWLLESLLNSVDVDGGRDDLGELPRFRAWLGAHYRSEAAGTATDEERRLAVELRDELRAELLSHHDRADRDRHRLDALACRVGLVARFGPDGQVGLAPSGTGVAGVLGEVLAAVVHAATDGTWWRLKICSSDTCRYVYYDRSRNASRRWCSMDVCGNRSKTRTYRQRQRAR